MAQKKVEKKKATKVEDVKIGAKRASEDTKSKTSNKKIKPEPKKEPPPPKEETSSSEEDSSDEEVPAKPAPKPTKKAAPVKSKKESSDESESESEEEEEAIKPSSKTTAKTPAKEESSDDSSDEDSDDEEEEKPVSKKPAVSKPTDVKMKTDDDSSEDEDDSSDEESSDEEEEEKPKTSKVNGVKGSKKDDDDDDDEDEDDDEDDDDDEDEKPAQKSKPSAKKESSDEESEDEDDDDESEEDDDDDDEEDEKPKKTVKDSKPATKKEESDDDDDDDESEEEEEEKKKETKPPAKPSTKIQTETTTPSKAGSKTLFVGNLAYSADENMISDFFSDVGQVESVRIATSEDGRSRGFCHVDFATEEDALKALAKSGQSIAGRAVSCDIANSRGSGDRTPFSGDRPQRNQSRGSGQTIFVKNFDKYQDEDTIRNQLYELFGECGDIRNVRIPTDRETGSIKGFAFIEFSSSDAVTKAADYNGAELGGKYIVVDTNVPERGESGGGRSGGRGDRGRGRGDRGGFRGGRGGRGGGRSKIDFSAAGSGKKTTFGDD